MQQLVRFTKPIDYKAFRHHFYERGYILAALLIVIWLLVTSGVPQYIPLQAASWLTFIALLITPGYCLADIITWRLRLDTIERLTLAFPSSIAVLAVPGTIALVQHLTLTELTTGWVLTSALVIAAWFINAVWVPLSTRSSAAAETEPGAGPPWSIGEMAMLLLLAVTFISIVPTLNLFKIDGDAYAVSTFAADALAGLPLNATEPLFGTDLGPGVRMVFNQALPMSYLWAELADIDVITLTASASRAMIALWAILAAYTLGKAAGTDDQDKPWFGSRRLGLLTAALQLFIFMAAPFMRGDNVSIFFFERTNADKFMVPVTMLPVVFALAIRYMRHPRWDTWLAAAVAAFAVSTIHPLIAAMLALALGAFGAFHILLGLRSRTVWQGRGLQRLLTIFRRHTAALDKTALRRSIAIWGLIPLVMFLPMMQLFLARGEAPLAASYPSTLEGWPVGSRLIPAIPFVPLRSLDLFGPQPDLARLQASDAYETTNPFLIWRFAVNMNRRRLIFFDLNEYISDPNIILEIPYLLALMALPFLLWRIRSRIAAQFAVSTTLAILFVMFNPVITPLIGSFVMPWILWRFIWLLPYALMIALPLHRFLTWASDELTRWLKLGWLQQGRHRLGGYITLAFVTLLGLALLPSMAQTHHTMNNRATAPVFYPTPGDIISQLEQRTASSGPVMVLADQALSVAIPAHVANANVVAHRVPTTSEVFPADQQDIALQRLIDQHTFFATPYLTERSLETLKRYDVRYIITGSGSDIDAQLRLADPWFEWLLDDQSYSLYAVHSVPPLSDSIRGNSALAARDWALAGAYFEAALINDEYDILARFGLAQIAQNQGDFATALTRFQDLATKVAVPHLHYYAGRLYAELGQTERSIAELVQAEQAAPHVALYHAALGDACLAGGNVNCAADQYIAAAANQSLPDEAARTIAEADYWREQGRLDQAIVRYERAVALQASDFNQFLLASAYQEAERYDLAEALIRQMRATNPTSAEIIATQANLYAAQGKLNEAIDRYRQAIWVQTFQGQETTSTRLALTQALLTANRVPEAEVEVNKAVTLQPYNPAAYRLKGDLHEQQKQFAEAVSAYQQAFQLDVTRIATFVAYSNELRHQGIEPDDSLSLLQAAIQINPDEATLYIALGDQLILLGDSQAAIDAYQLALNRFDSNALPTALRQQSTAQSRAFTYARLAHVHEDLGQIDTAMNYYQAAVSAAPDVPWANVLLGDAQRRRNQYDAAEATYRQAIVTYPAYVDLYARLAELLNARGDSVTASAFYDRAFELVTAQLQQAPAPGVNLNNQLSQAQSNLLAFQSDETAASLDYQTNDPILANLTDVAAPLLQPDANGDAILTLARLYQVRGYTDEAIDLYRQKLEQAIQAEESRALIAQYHKNLGDLYLNKNQYEQARTSYQQAIDLNGWWPEARLGLANAFSGQGDFEAAVRQLQTTVDITPGSIEAQIALANVLDQAGQDQAALDVYRQTARTSPGNAQATLALAQALQDRAHWDEAAAAYQLTIANNAGTPDAYLGLAELAMAQDQLNEAEDWLAQAAQIDQQNTNIYIRRGDLAQRQGNFAQALSWYQEALALPSTLRTTNIALIDSLLRYGDTEAVLSYIEKVLSRRANDAELLLREVRAYRLRGDLTAAQVALTEALAKFPGNGRLQAELAELVLAQGQIESGLSHYQTAIVQQPAEVANYLAASRILNAQGRIDQALTTLASGFSQVADPSALYSAQVAIYLEQGNPELALQTLETGLDQMGQTLPLLLAASTYDISRANFTQAEARYGDGLATMPNEASLYAALADLYSRRGESTSAIANYEQAVDIEPANPGYQLALGNTYQQAGRLAEAADRYGLILQFEPTFEAAYLALAALLQDQEQWDQAQDVYAQALANVPPSGLLLTQYAAFWLAREDQAQAASWLDQALQRSPIVPTYLAAAPLYQQLGQPEQARQLLQLAREQEPGSANVLLALGDLSRDQGDVATAEQLYQEAVALKPGLPTPYVRLGNLANDRGDLVTAQQYADAARAANPGALTP